MSDFASLIAPFPADRFFAEIYGRRHLHIPASAGARRMLDWARVNALLAIEGHWTDSHLKLVHNAIPVSPDRYCSPVQTMAGPQWRADPARVQAFLAQGASLVGNAVEAVAPELREVGATLNAQLGGIIGANLYVSFGGIGGFGPHYDLTEVFAFHCEGEKTWRIYEGQADAPIAFPQGDEASVRDLFRRQAGRVIDEVKMRPGDVLYIPRGRFHDALAQSEASMHVTFSVLPHTAKIVMRLLEQAALLEPAFRAYLPEAEQGGDTALAGRLAELGERLKTIMSSPQMLAAVKQQQQMLKPAVSPYKLPGR